MKALRTWIGRFFSPGALVILIISIVTSVTVALLPIQKIAGIPIWLSSTVHYEAYVPLIEEWNAAHPDHQYSLQLLHGSALERRMLAGFLTGTPVADVLETHLGITAKAFLGPVEDVGFVDLTKRLHREGIYDQINTPSFAPYTSRGHIFGVPHDVHPVLLAYRSDIVEAAGIDVSGIETWEDYFRVMRPLMRDFDGDGRPDRYLLSAWDTRGDTATMWILQAGGDFFDENDKPTVNSAINAAVLARIVTWFTGPKRVCIDVDAFTASGHRQRLEGVVIGTMVPDWMAGSWKIENPGLAGKLKLMPLPAWEKGGRRTSVAGGTMIGISKRSAHIEESWALIKHLYLSPKLAERMYRVTSIISPVKSMWSLPFYDEPDPYFSGQPAGRMYINQAPDVPRRSSSPYTTAAAERVTSALIDLRAYADRTGTYDEADLLVESQRLLDLAQDSLQRLIDRNLFLLKSK
ncbi:MAG: extracellular solute-binding protein [Cephaloticoccus sp.]|nr:extracellular solute-binding protein [Cephaloticoccus sp.]MCF7761665.1 extracellular solute-binding protein [Cephaloticoccus sp.]